MMYENGIKILENRNYPERAITSASQRIFKKSYEQLQIDLGSNRVYSLTVSSPITRNLFTAMRELKTNKEAAETLGFNARYGEQGAEHLSRFCAKISGGKRYSELKDDCFWFSVRYALRTSRKSRLGGLGIAYELGLCDENSDNSIKRRYQSYFLRYVPKIFNGMTIAEARRFYFTGFLGE